MREQIVDIRQCGRAEPGFFQRGQQSARVFGRCLYEDVEIERRARYAVKYGGDSPDDDVLNVVGGEGREYVLKAVEQVFPLRGRAGSEERAP